MLRRSIDALALLAFPASVFVAGWLHPRTDPVSGATAGGRPALLIAVLIAGAVVSIGLSFLRRRLRHSGRSGLEAEAMRWLITGWPLPLPRWRARTGFVRPPEVSSANAPGPAGLGNS